MTTTRKNDLAVVDHSTSIAHSVTAAPAIGDFDDLDLSPEDGTLPLLPMNRKVGQDDSGILVGNERVLELDFVWAAKSISRAHFPAKFDHDPGGRPDCWSVDGVAPSPTIAEPKHDTCAGCPFSFEATGGKDGPDSSPGCSKNLEALIYVADGDMSRVARLRFGGIAFKEARAYWDSFRFARPKKYAFQYLTRMRLVSTKTDNGNFLVPEFSRVEEIGRDEAIAIGTDAKALTGTFRSLVSDDIVTAEVRDSEHTAPGPFDDEPPFAAVDGETGEITYDPSPVITAEATADLFGGTVGSDEPF